MPRCAAIAHARRLAAGGPILDVGGISRPGSAACRSTKSSRASLPVLDGLRELELPISIGTTKPP
jgi:dihydropteroate synthase